MLARLSLRARFLIPVICLVLLGMGASTLISHIRSKQALESALHAEINQRAESTLTTIQSWVADRQLDVKNWSGQNIFVTALKDTFVGQSARKTANQNLVEIKKDYPYYENLFVANASGDIVVSADESVIGSVKVNDRKYFQSALEGKACLSELMKSRGTGNPVFMIASPVRDKEGLTGVFFGVVDLNSLSSRAVDSVKVGKTGYAYLFQEDGIVIAHPVRDNILKLNLKEFDFGREMIAKGDGFIVYTFKGVEEIVAFKRSKELGWTVGVVSSRDEVLAPIRSLGYTNVIIALSVVVLAGLIILLLVQSIVKPLQRITEGLGEASAQVSSGSGQISKSSQSLAEGTSEQAASIEESSSSLEEMSAMTKLNADNARQADALMKTANEVIAKANVSMNDLTGSMAQISKASEETSKIIKTIDEIAFQTNLLALNAAVEAARAGEAGAGFAVVADEVRNLAMRAAEAAKSTSTLIEGTVKRIKQGSELVTKTNGEFGEVAKSAETVGKLVAEIAAASHEQAQGIEHVSKAVAEMDKVVHQNAANAEESAAASEEMNSQAEQMKAVVNDLVSTISGSSKGQFASMERRVHNSLPELTRIADKVQTRTGYQRGVKTPPLQMTREQRYEQVIPLKEEEFKDF